MYCTGLPLWEKAFNLDKDIQVKVLGKNSVHSEILANVRN